jgi:hypothetical protein
MRSRWTACLLVLLSLTFLLTLCDVYAASRSIPAGAAVTVRTDKQITIGTAQPGDIFPATLDEDIMESGKVLVKRGAPADIRLMKVREDQDELAFKLYTISVGGQKLRVVSDTARGVARKAASQQQQQPGLGGALGQAIGGALGTGQGGLTWSGAQKQDAKVPAGTFLEFTLREPVDLGK